MKSKVLPPTYFFVCLLLSVGLHFALPVAKVVPSPYNLVGIVFVIAGMALNLWTDSLFKQEKTTVKPDEAPTRLLTSGPFRISRHPMYLGMVSILLGVAIGLRSVITFVFPVLFVVLMEAAFIPVEERNLEKAFGESYLSYRKKVRRWL